MPTRYVSVEVVAIVELTFATLAEGSAVVVDDLRLLVFGLESSGEALDVVLSDDIDGVDDVDGVDAVLARRKRTASVWLLKTAAGKVPELTIVPAGTVFAFGTNTRDLVAFPGV
jgi:hypothetical protein